jgi:hypothetical protein
MKRFGLGPIAVLTACTSSKACDRRAGQGQTGRGGDFDRSGRRPRRRANKKPPSLEVPPPESCDSWRSLHPGNRDFIESRAIAVYARIVLRPRRSVKIFFEEHGKCNMAFVSGAACATPETIPRWSYFKSTALIVVEALGVSARMKYKPVATGSPFVPLPRHLRRLAPRRSGPFQRRVTRRPLTS